MTADDITGDDLGVVDTSVWNRLPRSPAVLAALQSQSVKLKLCFVPTVILEIGFSARSKRDWNKAMGQIASFDELPLRPQTREAAVRMQGLLWDKGMGRAVGALDVLTAAVALDHGAIILHYDRDFETLASVCPELRQEWIVPAGSVA
ncbi:MAG: PIN domain-containing protein [Propionibacteriaceae bacterium]|jgi:predicted nucleic acid-binding protein|nr:PIN domain-containing protein [Propionibacteriaceae bacterium]